MSQTTKILLTIILTAIIVTAGIYVFLKSTQNAVNTNEATTNGVDQVETEVFTNSSESYSVSFPVDWNVGVNGSPDPSLIETVYFFRSPAEQSKGFDAVNITTFSSKGASYEELLEQNPEHIIKQSQGMTHVLTYSNKNFPEETRKIFELISNSFQAK
ncbi:hypothetical protein CO173_00160 [Candidatus Uhrbacteria bacterium CG_4_9_14_3_um_filter_41_35]|uniref:PsbP C-terminal domain-containing protein n=1 Tax=Candidatus Uhrbacteria bacterium CG_4_9_14_3_um_filter_41_35 TaxID=1975034 RepID=A0A2M7XGR9_9BACT|nr:MAG: hypothetical protein CO173_00160 [Candidatus Uhrbacteria bacterium CG_4_9_14_3_um_filter_41_35]